MLMNITLSEELLAHTTAKWKEDEFFAPETVVLGLDIGMEGIGIAIRQGRKLLYCKSLLYPLPEAEALKTRRLYRAARHARKNRRVRLRRLKALFVRHGLPWVSDDIMSRSDPFRLRYRALKSTLASKEALSICIRSCVDLRGYDYFALSRADGEFPWGEDNSLSEAKKWVSSQYVDEQMSEVLIALAPELTFKNKELTTEQTEEWAQLVRARAAKAEQEGIPAMLGRYVRQHLNERRAHGYNFPRSHVEAHLRTILERHAHLIQDADGFATALFLPCSTEKNRRKAIFHYNRKTPDEAKRHYESKVKKCPYCEWLGMDQKRCGMANDTAIRRWNLLDFLSNRTFETVQNKLPMPRATLPEACIRALAGAIEKGSSWKECEKLLKQNLLPCQLAPKSDWNKAQLEKLKDIVVPAKNARSKRAACSVDAAQTMYTLATEQGNNFSAACIEAWKKEVGLYTQRQLIVAQSGIFPQVQMLLGTLKKRGDDKGQCFAATGQLQRIFAQLNSEGKLHGKWTPDYCVVECVRDAAINKKQAQEREKEQKANREKRDQLVKKFGRTNAGRADFLRMLLFREQQITENGITDCRCPFTGRSLGADPFSDNLELAHLYPDSRGGLYVRENLVLTTRKVNAEMGNRTPKEAASAGLPGWLGLTDMLKLSNQFRWGANKRCLFAFEPSAEGSFPQFNNMTRVSQLAAALRNYVAIWMGIAGDSEAIRTRIGNPGGLYTAAARRGLYPDFDKDRSNNLHHRIDAAVMSCIPPAGGINDVRYGGIFYTKKEGAQNDRRLTCLSDLPVPDFAAMERDGSVCPILYPHSQSKYQSLGDSTFWGVDKKGKLHQRTPLKPDKELKAGDVHAALLRMMSHETMGASTLEENTAGAKQRRLGEKLVPTEKEIQQWQQKAQAAFKGDESVVVEPLRLANGTPVRSYWKFGSKGNVDKSPLGWSGTLKGGVFDQLRNLTLSNDRMELWLGWNARKKRWEYYKRLIPAASALAGLKRMGLPWRGREGAPDYLLAILEKNKAKDLRSMICGILPPYAVKIAQFRKGDVFNLIFERDDKTVEKLQKKSQHFDMLDHPQKLQTWGCVSAIKSEGILGFKCLTHKDRKKSTLGDAAKLAQLMGLPASPADCALSRHMTPPA